MPTIEVSSHESSGLQDVANALLKAKRVVVITGAGISTNSGIPDFRSENGLYSLIQAQFDAAARADSTRDRDDFPETQPRKRQRTGLSTSSGSGEGSRIHSDDGSRDETGAELIAAAKKLQEEQEGTAAPFTPDPKMGGQMRRMSLGASALLSSPLSSLPGGWEQYEDYMGSDIGDNEEKQEDNEGEDSDSQRSRALRTLPNIKGKDLFDAQIWSDPLRTSVFYTFATTLRQKVREAQPTPSHHFISHLRDRGKLVRCYTQNIDMIEEKVGLSTELEKGPGMRSRFTRKTTLQRAESMVAIESATTTESPNDSADETERISASQPLPKLSRISSDLSQMDEDCPSQSQGDFEDAGRANDRRLKCITGVECVYLHGSLEYLRCFVCAKTCEWDSVEAETMSGEQPECLHCAGATAARKERGKRALGIGKLRPDIVLYGEDHPKSHLISPIITNDLAAAPDMMLIMGTSLRVHGLKVMVREFAKAVHNKGGHVVFVNFTKPPESIWGDVIDYWVSWDCDAWVTDMKERIPLMWVPIGEEDEWKRKQKEVAKAAALEVKAAEKEAKAEAKAAEKEAKAEAKAAEKEARAAQKAVEKAAKEEAKVAEREAKLEAKEREKQAKLEARLAQRSAKSGSASLTPNGSVEPDGKSSDGSSVSRATVVGPDGTTIPGPKRKCTKRKKHEADTSSSIVSADHSGDQSSVMSLKDSRMAFTNGLRPSNAPTSAPTYTAYAAEVKKKRGGKLKTENVGQLTEESGDGSKNADSLTVVSMIQPELPVYPFIPMSAQKKTLEEIQDAENRRRRPSMDSTKMNDAMALEDKSQAPPLLHNPFTSRTNSYLPQRAPPLPIASTTSITTETPTTTQAFTQIDPKSTVEYGPFKFDPFNPSKKIPRRMSMNMMPPMSTLPRSRRPSISVSLSKFAAEVSVSSQTPRPRGHRKTLSWTQNPFFMQDSLVGSMKSPRNSISGGLGLGSFGSGFGGGFASGYGSGFMSNKPRTKSMSHFGLRRPSALSSLIEIEKSRQEMEYIHPTIEQDDDELELPKLPSEDSADMSWGPEDQLAAESEVGSRPVTMEAVEDEDNVAVEDKEEEEETDVTVTEATDGDGAVVIKSEFSMEPEVTASKFFAKPKHELFTETASQEPVQEPKDTPMSTDLETVTESPTPEETKLAVSTSSKVAPKSKANTKDKAAKRKRAPVKRALPPPLMTRARTRVQAQGKRVLRKRK